MHPCSGVNVICGDNGQGKTNLLEGIALFSGVRSFRGANSRQLVRYGCEFARLKMDFFAEKRDQSAVMVITPERKELTLNGVKQQAASAMIGRFCCVVFSPDHMNLVNGAAVDRRHFIDSAISQCRPRFVSALYMYNQIINQRNALLKKISAGYGSPDELEVWDISASGYAAEIALRRSEYCLSLSEAAGRIYDGISSGKEIMTVNYSCSYMVPGDKQADIENRFLDILRENRATDISLGYTTRGPQRDDLQIKLSGRDIRPFGSQGQKRSAVLALKLAEAEHLAESTGDKPVAILDDVMSELDKSRQNFLLNKLEDWQVFISCCDPGPLELMDKGSVFVMDGGRLTAMS